MSTYEMEIVCHARWTVRKEIKLPDGLTEWQLENALADACEQFSDDELIEELNGCEVDSYCVHDYETAPPAPLTAAYFQDPKKQKHVFEIDGVKWVTNGPALIRCQDPDLAVLTTESLLKTCATLEGITSLMMNEISKLRVEQIINDTRAGLLDHIPTGIGMDKRYLPLFKGRTVRVSKEQYRLVAIDPDGSIAAIVVPLVAWAHHDVAAEQIEALANDATP